MFISSVIIISALSIPVSTVSNINLTEKYCENYYQTYKQNSTLEYNYITSEKYIEEIILKHQDILPEETD
jgi:hypothetical protein